MIIVSRDSCELVFDSWDGTVQRRKIGLTGLSISENAGVVTLERIVQNVAAESVEHHLLTREGLRARVQGVKTMVERECFCFVPATGKFVDSVNAMETLRHTLEVITQRTGSSITGRLRNFIGIDIFTIETRRHFN